MTATIERSEQNNIGKPNISEFIETLKFVMSKHGDLPVVGAYDGDWNTDVSMFIADDRIIIGSIS